MTTPSVTIIGPGAIGCAAAAALIQAGHHPTIFGRTVFDRLVLSHPEGQVACDIEVTTDAAQLEATEVVVLATKANQIADVADALAATTATGTIVVVAQNGLDHEARVRPFIADAARAMPAVVFVPATRLAPGHVEITGPPSLTIPDGADGRAIADLFEGSFLTVHRSDDWLTEGWKKLIINAGLGAVGVLVRKDNETTLSDPAGHDLILRIMQEILPVARAAGASITDDFAERVLTTVRERGGARRMSSIVVDRMNGQPTEWRERNEHIGIVGRHHGIETPLNDLCTTLIQLGEPPH